MDTSSLKSFAPAVRRQLLEAVERKLDYVLSADTPDLRTASAQVERLRAESAQNRSQVIERVAYTWFNRLAALRFLDARGWHPFRARVLTPAGPSETQPEILKMVRNGVLPDELRSHTDLVRLNDLLDGRLPSPDPQGEVYRHLVLAACRFYHALLPFLFERLDDETELLLPDDVLTEHSITHGFRTQIRDEDCDEVEILGWLYQFYISEKKDQVMAKKEAVASEDIPAVTQLFTPHWIVRYLVENSLGRLWLRSRPGSSLRSVMPYYVDDPDRQAPADCLTVNSPEEIRVLDPACGSGHMLAYAFDLLCQIYEEEGYASADIPRKILTHNLYGLEVCSRATQLAQFALLAKAREKSTSAFQEASQPQVTCLEDVAFDPNEVRSWLENTRLAPHFSGRVLQQIHQFKEDTPTFGSLIQPILSAEEIAGLKEAIAQAPIPTDLLLQETTRKVILALNQAEMLTQRYHVVVVNPPYMGRGSMSSAMKAFAESWFPASKADTFAMFIERALGQAMNRGVAGLITMQSWMFLPSFERLRVGLVQHFTLVTMWHLGARAFETISGEVVQTTAFVLAKSPKAEYKPEFRRLVAGRTATAKLELLSEPTLRYVRLSQRRLLELPGSPLAYWMSEALVEAFKDAPSVADLSISDGQTKSGNNDMYLRQIWEVGRSTVGMAVKWALHPKGGDDRRWYGNVDAIINWSEEARRHYRLDRVARILPEYLWRRIGICWTLISTDPVPGFRTLGEEEIFNLAAPTIFPKHPSDQDRLLALLNSRVSAYCLALFNPTINRNIGDVCRIPVLGVSADVEDLARLAVSIARMDWNNFETSWDFQDLPLLRTDLKGQTLEEAWRNWERCLKTNIARMQELETENNRLWIDAYGLQDELSPEVPEEEITLARPDRRKDMAAFVSYAVGCMMGRYSLDKPGLILADAGDTLKDYLDKLGRSLDGLSFVPDEDAIIPVLSGEWFEDDIVARTRNFLRVTFGESTLDENLRFIEEALGKELRKYFATDFYKDHLQTYKKRPIYWMFQSPKKGFQCLVYLHRYTRDTANRVLNRYLREYLSKMHYRLEHLERLLASESTSPHDKTRYRKEADALGKTIRECEEYEREVLLPLAQERIELDLDDGVKVNYLKLGPALAPIPGLAAKEPDE